MWHAFKVRGCTPFAAHSHLQHSIPLMPRPPALSLTLLRPPHTPSSARLSSLTLGTVIFDSDYSLRILAALTSLTSLAVRGGREAGRTGRRGAGLV